MIRYIIHFKGNIDNNNIDGYYHESQPYFSWSFTNDLNKAKLYKTLKNAENLVEHQKLCKYKELTATILEVQKEIKLVK